MELPVYSDHLSRPSAQSDHSKIYYFRYLHGCTYVTKSTTTAVCFYICILHTVRTVYKVTSFAYILNGNFHTLYCTYVCTVFEYGSTYSHEYCGYSDHTDCLLVTVTTMQQLH